jgi:hypothetical protein
MSSPLPALAAGMTKDQTSGLWLPPWIYPPAEAEPFDWQGNVGLPALLATATILSFVVPKGRNGVIRAYANQLVGGLFTDGSGVISFSINHDNQPFRYYNKILFSLGLIQNPTYHPFGLRVFNGQTITFNVRNATLAVAGQLVNARMMGWYYPAKYDDPNLWMVQ